MKIVKISPFLVCLLCISVFLGWGKVICLTLAASLLHELGHVAVIVFFRRKISRISIGVCGAIIETEILNYKQEILCAAIGPLINLLACLICFQRYYLFGLVNFILFAYNILPVYPLDGGRILRCVLLLRLSEDKVLKILCYVNGTVIALSVLASVCFAVRAQCGLWPMFFVASVLCKIQAEAFGDEYLNSCFLRRKRIK